MNREEAAELIDKQDRHIATKGRYAGMAPGVNLGQLHKAQRILAGEEEENVQRPADLAKHRGPLVQEALLEASTPPEFEKVLPSPKELGLVAPESEPEPPAPGFIQPPADPGVPPAGEPTDPGNPTEPPPVPPTE